MTQDKKDKIFDIIFNYANKFGYSFEDENRFSLATSECVYQNDDMQIEGLETICKMLDVLND